MKRCTSFLLTAHQFITLCFTQYLWQYGRLVVPGEGVGGIVHHTPVVVFHSLTVFLTLFGLLEITLTA